VISLSQTPLPDNTQRSQETSTPTAGFEAAIPASEQPQTYALERAATGIGSMYVTLPIFRTFKVCCLFCHHVPFFGIPSCVANSSTTPSDVCLVCKTLLVATDAAFSLLVLLNRYITVYLLRHHHHHHHHHSRLTLCNTCDISLFSTIHHEYQAQSNVVFLLDCPPNTFSLE